MSNRVVSYRLPVLVFFTQHFLFQADISATGSDRSEARTYLRIITYKIQPFSNKSTILYGYSNAH
ncbi:hypothetical protein [Nostoc sp. ChiQUE01b]|uniref:hypothetical protein n=1 Tax=Nostoc sp. ChiQUE01b TaxID=3075376 RepID=UPI002AD4285A|nr:hypothetical protein [Nostoc sp. ChiQUE01b]MDZ8257020.1 hypothetical protein [Nostoc sp. ChiQUE01b]